MNVTNQMPAVLSPVYQSTGKGQFDPVGYMKATIATPLFQAKVQGTPVTINESGQNLKDDDIVNQVLGCLGDTVNINGENWCKELFNKTLVYYDQTTPLGIANLFAVQSATKEKLPPPSTVTVYTPGTDVIPAAREFLAGQCSYDKFFASLAFFARPQTLGIYFANETCFDAFKTWFDTQTQVISSLLPAQTNQLLQDFTNLHLNGLTESLVLRNNDSENNDEFSFARILASYLMTYTTQVGAGEYGILPFNLGELYCPRTVVFVNVEKHAHASSADVKNEWDIINQSLSMKINMITQNQLTKLTAAARSLKKISAAAQSAAAGISVQRAASAPFKKTAPNTIDITRLVKRVMDKMATVARSENSYKSIKMTFQKPNRRDPDDFNKQGKSVSVKFRPDLHVYIDCSGSISEENYREAIMACIRMAQKFNINIYFNSFSSYLSQCTKLKTKDKTLKQVYAEFQRVPKVSGGTDYEPIWHYINKSPKRRRELSLIITDFEWTPRSQYVEHPKNLYYLPCSKCNWQSITYWADQFVKAMANNDPDCRRHLLF